MHCVTRPRHCSHPWFWPSGQCGLPNSLTWTSSVRSGKRSLQTAFSLLKSEEVKESSSTASNHLFQVGDKECIQFNNAADPSANASHRPLQNANQGPVPNLGSGHSGRSSTHYGRGRGYVPEDTRTPVLEKRQPVSGTPVVSGQVKKKAEQWAEDATESIDECWNATSRQARHLASQTLSITTNALDSAGRFIRQNPVSVLISAAAVGFLLGCYRRSQSDSF